MMWLCHHSWSWGTHWGVLLASWLCCNSNNLISRYLQRHMPIIPQVPPQASFLFHSWAFHQFIMWYICASYDVCFLLSSSLIVAVQTNGGSAFEVCNAATLRVYPWQVFVPPGDGHMPMPGVHRMAAHSTGLEGASCCLFSYPQPFHHYGGAYSIHQILHLLNMVGDWSFSRLCSTQWHRQLLSLWCMLNLDDSGMLIEYQSWWYMHLVSRVLCYSITYLPWFHGQGVNNNPLPMNQVVRITPFGPSSQRHWPWSWFCPHRLCKCTRTWCFL